MPQCEKQVHAPMMPKVQKAVLRLPPLFGTLGHSDVNFPDFDGSWSSGHEGGLKDEGITLCRQGDGAW
eukprot:8272807-Alexandrium_andersonii.AAC.1